MLLPNLYEHAMQKFCSSVVQLAAAVVLGTALSGCAVPGLSPYAGQEQRAIKALSSAEIDGLLAGRGMGYARAAELNGYPGPMHVLELATQLELTAEQKRQTEDVFARMQGSAREQGARLVQAERELDELFRSGVITQAVLDQALASIAAAQAQVRAAHLRAHLEQTRILRPEQVTRYAALRGYNHDGQHGHAHH